MGSRSAGAFRLSSEPAKLAEDGEFAFSSAYRREKTKKKRNKPIVKNNAKK